MCVSEERRWQRAHRASAVPHLLRGGALAFDVHAQRVDEVTEDLQARVGAGGPQFAGHLQLAGRARLGLHGGTRQDRLRGEDPDAGPNGQRECVGRP